MRRIFLQPPGINSTGGLWISRLWGEEGVADVAGGAVAGEQGGEVAEYGFGVGSGVEEVHRTAFSFKIK